MEEIIKVISVVFISSFKFIAGPTLAYAYDFNYLETILLTVGGGMAGVVLISYYTPKMIFLWKWMGNLWKEIFSPEKNKEIFSAPKVDVETPVSVKYEYVTKGGKNEKKNFTSRNRRMLKIWNRWGLTGLALITPVTISIPVGTFIATRLARNKKKVLLYMFLSVLFWSVLISSAFEVYQIVSLSQIESLFFE